MNKKLPNWQSVKEVGFLSAFDLDRTLFYSNSSYCFGRFLCQKKYLPFSSLFYIVHSAFRHRLGLLSIENLHQQAFQRLFIGRSASEVKLWALRFLEEKFDDLLYLPAIERLKLAQEEGHVIALLSSSPDFLVEPIAARLKIPIWDATRYSVDKYGRFCHITSLMLGDTKAILLEKLRRKNDIRLENTYAYSDSHLDLPFLHAAGHPIGVNPNRQLRSLCQKNRWLII